MSEPEEKWYASGRGIFCRDAGCQLASMPVSVKWHEDTERIVALLNAGQECLDWAHDTGDCHICSYDRQAGKPHEYDCPLRKYVHAAKELYKYDAVSLRRAIAGAGMLIKKRQDGTVYITLPPRRTTGYIPVCLNCSDSSITVNDDGLCAECDDIRRGGAGEESR